MAGGGKNGSFIGSSIGRIIGGIDVGSTGAKISVFDEQGNLLHTGYRDYPVSRHLSAHEIDANQIREAVLALLREAAAREPGLCAVGIATFGESFVLLGDGDRVLYPAMMYTDPRGTEEIAELKAQFGEDWLCATTGVAPHSMFSLPKLMWIRKHEPEVFSAIRQVLLMEDYVAYLLTGERVIDYSLAARTMAFDIRTLDWSRELLQAAGIPLEWMSRVVPTGTLAGTIRPDLAERLGLPRGLAVVACCHDQVAAAVGAGVLKPGMATDGSGTVECMTPVFTEYDRGGSLQKNNYALVPFLHKGTYVSYAFIFTGGSLVKWFLDTLAGNDQATARAKGISVYAQLESQMADKPTGILVLPHFAGAATPYMDTGSKGGIVGLTLENSSAELYRAILEGVGYEMAVNIERLRDSGIQISSLHATGGGAKSELWLQMKADILNLPVHRMDVAEAGTVGVILLTGAATGVYDDLEKAARTLVGVQKTFWPRREQHEAYSVYYERYRKLYQAIRPLV